VRLFSSPFLLCVLGGFACVAGVGWFHGHVSTDELDAWAPNSRTDFRSGSSHYISGVIRLGDG
jgi:hypothetical protein